MPQADSQPRPLSRHLPRQRLLLTLEHSQKEAVASSAMTSSCDNFINAFALHLGASNIQMGLLVGIPQLLGSLMQLVSVWAGSFLSRRRLILFFALAQTLLMFGFATLAVLRREGLVPFLLLLFLGYHILSNLIQPQWRAWMGSLVPQKQRGSFFASRSRLTMGTSLATFLLGGLLLTLSDSYSLAWIGFFFLFFISAIGRALSAYFLSQMHDPEPARKPERSGVFLNTLRRMRESMRDPTFRNYTFFVAGMQGSVAISAPFFAVYMLQELHYTYIEYSLNLTGSIGVQFLLLRLWGRIGDRHGHRLVMLLSSALLPLLPLLWLVSDNYYWLLLTQMISGLAWSGFNLSIGNYLYDIRPHHSDFATYAAAQSSLIALPVFLGGLAGGYLASVAPELNSALPLRLGSSLFLVFLCSSLLRLAILLWFIPRAEEPHIRTRPQLLRIIFRIARYNSISGLSLDWLTVAEKPRDDNKPAD